MWIQLFIIGAVICISIIIKSERKVIPIVITFSLIFLIYGGYMYNNMKVNYYNNLMSVYYIFDDLEKDINVSINKDYIEEKDLRRYLYETRQELEPVLKNIKNNSKYDMRINTRDLSFLVEYFRALDYFYDKNNNKLPQKEKDTLNEIIHKTELIESYLISEEHSRVYDSVSSKKRIANEIKAMEKICEDTVSRMIEYMINN